MTEEELAKEYVDKLYAEKVSKEDYDKDGRILYRSEDISDAFLNGLNGKKPKWHKVADGDLPKDEDYKWCISSNGVYYVARYEELFVSWTSQEHKEVCCPIAWCEIPQYTEVKE